LHEAREIIVKPISAADASRIVKTCHYSGKVVNNSQVHFGVFIGDKCGGAMQFGPSLDKRKMLGLVRGTLWNEFLELNRMAFADWLPRNSESRAIAVVMRMLRKAYPWLKWVVSFADATQCGDGTIYRASGFVLTAIKENNQIWEAPSGETFNDTSIRPGIGGERERERAKRVFSSQAMRNVDHHSNEYAAAQRILKAQVFSRTSLTDGRSKQQQQAKAIINRTTTKAGHILETGASSMKAYKEAGWKPKAGFQLRYIYFLKPGELANLTAPVLPFSEIVARGAGMYKGRPKQSIDAPGDQPGEGGEAPTRTLQTPQAPNGQT
jgi:hypothetical protein